MFTGSVALADLEVVTFCLSWAVLGLQATSCSELLPSSSIRPVCLCQSGLPALASCPLPLLCLWRSCPVVTSSPLSCLSLVQIPMLSSGLLGRTAPWSVVSPAPPVCSVLLTWEIIFGKARYLCASYGTQVLSGNGNDSHGIVTRPWLSVAI